MNLRLRHMRVADIPQVIQIDREAFLTPWSAASYQHEIESAKHSYMVVLEHSQPRPLTGWQATVGALLRRLGLGRLRARLGLCACTRQIVGYGGLWLWDTDSGHISTLAVRQEHKGRGYGEILLAAMVRRALWAGATHVGLEVRASNSTAQRLYHKYEFEMQGIKPQYYRDDDEDAHDMRLDLNDPHGIARLQQRYAAICAAVPFSDDYTKQPPPRDGDTAAYDDSEANTCV
jgi:[ribosomal protein S18]-alanine N-acetyltransferase